MATIVSESAVYEAPLASPTGVVSSSDAYEAPLDGGATVAQELADYSLFGGGGGVLRVFNRVWDGVASAFVRWSTAFIDSSGTAYPGPGTFGVDTSNFVVETAEVVSG